MYNIAQVISLICNGHCNYCMCGNELLMSDKDKKEVDIDDLIDFYRMLDSDEVMQVKITGGETFHPLVVDRTQKLVEYLLYERKGPLDSIQINSNGYFKIPDFCKHPAVKIQFSLDGDKDYQNKTCGIPVFDRVIANIKHCQKSGINCYIMSVITNGNLKNIENLIEATKYLNGVEIKSQYVAPVGFGKEMHGETMLGLRTVEEANKRWGFVRPYHTICPHTFTDNRNKTFCIKANGAITQCPILQQFETKYNIYNITKEEIESGVLKNELNFMFGMKSCCFPNGFYEYYNSLDDSEKEEFESLLEPQQKAFVHERMEKSLND